VVRRAFNVENAAKNIFFALYALQHRGQESAGIATSHHHTFNVHRGMGLVSQIFNEDVMSTMSGRIGIGHTRYSTKGSSVIANAQPFVLETDQGRIAVAHNGQLVHETMLRKRLLRAGTGLFTTTDSEIIAQMLARDNTDQLANIRLVYSAAEDAEAGPADPATAGAAAVGVDLTYTEEPGAAAPASPARRLSAHEAARMRASPAARKEAGADAPAPAPRGGCMTLPDAEEEDADGTESPVSDDAPAAAVARVHSVRAPVAAAAASHARADSAGSSAGSASSPVEGAIVLASASRDDPMVQRISALVAQAEGAFAFAVLAREAVYGTRDRFGFRPLCIGKRVNADGSGPSYFFSSESCALGTVGATLVREVHPGEVVRIDAHGVHSWVAMPQLQPRIPPALCVFEYVYFARPDSLIEGQLVHSVRQRLGAVLAEECHVEADIVSGVPDSSIAAAIGYSAASGLPYTEVFCKNRYIGRTFIQPDQTLRKNAIHLKFNALTHNVRGKRLILIDDSIVRGNTLRKLVPLLREAGAAEIHIRISSPPLRHPCYMGVDIGTYEELIAHRVDSIDAIRDHIGADSLEYITHDGMMRAVRSGIGGHHAHSAPRKGGKGARRLSVSSAGGNETSSHSELEAASDSWSMPTGHCSACFTGDYPIKLEW